MIPSRERVEEVVKQLKANGWEHVCSLMTGDTNSGPEYGMKFVRDGESFWLNKDTIDDLPK